MQSLRALNTVAASMDAPSHVLGGAVARLMYIAGAAPADLIGLAAALADQVPRSCQTGRARTSILGFSVEPEITAMSHLTYIYDSPRSLHVVDVALSPLEVTFTSAEIRLHSQDPDGSARKAAHRRTCGTLAAANH